MSGVAFCMGMKVAVECRGGNVESGTGQGACFRGNAILCKIEVAFQKGACCFFRPGVTRRVVIRSDGGIGRRARFRF